MHKSPAKINKQRRLLQLAATAILTGSVPLLSAWHEVGNGGDPLRLLFSTSRDRAAVVVARMHPDERPSEPAGDA